MNIASMTEEDSRYVLCFRSLFDEGRGYSFPCDSSGHVALDALTERGRSNYFFARTGIGREFAMPAVQTREQR